MKFRYYIYIFFLLINKNILGSNKVQSKKKSKEDFLKVEYMIEPMENCDYYQLLLFDFLYKHINLDHLSKVNLSSIVSRKSQYWNLFEASSIVIYAFSKKKYTKYAIFALERLYALSGDAYLSELVLWNLANLYEKYGRLRLACEVFSQFKKIFPGSEFYWLSRYKEIVVSYKMAKEYFLDISYNENIIQLIKEYIVDKTILEEESFGDIITILHDLSFKMIKQHIHTGQHYLKKYSYTHEVHTILSAWQRLKLILNDIDFFLDICTFESDHYRKNKLYYGVLTEMQNIVALFFKKHEIPLPCGEDYIDMHQDIIQYIQRNKYILLDDLDSLFYKLILAIEVYYEK